MDVLAVYNTEELCQVRRTARRKPICYHSFGFCTVNISPGLSRSTLTSPEVCVREHDLQWKWLPTHLKYLLKSLQKNIMGSYIQNILCTICRHCKHLVCHFMKKIIICSNTVQKKSQHLICTWVYNPKLPPATSSLFPRMTFKLKSCPFWQSNVNILAEVLGMLY